MKRVLLLLPVLLISCKSIHSIRTTGTIPLDFKGRIALAKMQAHDAEQGPAASRITAAKLGIAAANAARTDNPDRVEGHYWYAINVGLLADADRLYGVKAVEEMQTSLQRAIEIDEKYDEAGPLRVMGILLVRAPGPPVSSGSPRKGLRFLQRAVALAPDYPENQLYLAEALQATGKIDEARAALHKVIDAPALSGRQAESEAWRRAAQKLLADWQ